MAKSNYSFQDIKVLIVEDNLPMYELIKSVIMTFGFKKIYRAQDGKQGFDTFCRIKADLIITDWEMKPVSGIEMIEMIRKNPQSPNPFVPIIMLSGYGQKSHIIQARDVGTTEFLIKPFCAQQLYKRIEHIIEKPRDFVQSEHFFGPDRRRHKHVDFEGGAKREDDILSPPHDDIEYVYIDVDA